MATEKKSRSKIRRISLSVLAAVIILLGGIYALRSAIIAPYVIRFLERTVAAELGIQISIGYLGGSYISDLEVKNITTVRRLRESFLADVQLRRLKLNYRLLDIFEGLPALLAGTVIDLEGAGLSIQLTGEMTEEAESNSGSGFSLPSGLPQIRIHDSFIELKSPGYETRFKGISLTADSTPSGASRLQLQVAQWSLKHPALRDIAVELEARMFYSHQRLRIEKMLVDKRLLAKSTTIGLRGLPEDIPFEIQLAPAGGQLTAKGRVAANRLQVALVGSGLNLSRVSGLLAPSAVPFGGHLALRGNLDLSISDPKDMISDLTIRLDNGSVDQTGVEQLTLRFTADGRHMGVADLQLANGANRMRISRASVAAAVLFESDLDAILRSLEVEWYLEAVDIPAALKPFGLMVEGQDNRVPPHRLILTGRLKDGNLIIPEGRLDVDGGNVLLKAARMALPLGERTLRTSPVSGDLSVDLPDAEILSRIFALPALGGGIQGQIKVDGTLQAPLGSARISGQAMTYRNRTLGNLTLRAKGERKGIVIESAILERGKDRASGRGTIRLTDKSFDNFRVALSVSDMGPYFSELLPLFRPPSEKTLSVGGGIKATAKLAGPITNPTGSLNLDARQIRVENTSLGDADVRLKFSDEKLQVLSARFHNANDSIELAGEIQRNPADTEFNLTFSKAAFTRQGRTLLALERKASCRIFRNGRMIFDNLALAGSAGRVSINGRLELAGAANLQITVSQLNSDGWLDLLVADRLQFQGLNARIKLAGQSSAPSFAIEGKLDNLGSPAVPVAFSGRFNLEYGNKVLKIHDFEWQGQEGQHIELAGVLPLDLFGKNVFAAGQIELSGNSRIDDAGTLGFLLPRAAGTAGTIRWDLDLGGTWTHPSGRLHLTANDLKRPSNIRPLPPGPYAIDADFRFNGDRVILKLLEASSAGWKFQAKGQWRGAPALPDLVTGNARIKTGQLDIEASLSVSDLSWIPPEVEGVRRLNGRLEAQGNLRGPLSAPRGEAIIKLSEAEFAPDFDMPSLRGLNLEAAVTQAALSIRSLTGQLGGAPFELTGLWKLAAGEDSTADLRLRGENILLYRNEDLLLRADTDLTLKGPLARLELAGEVAVTDGRFSKNFGVIEGFAAAGKSNTGGGLQLFSIQKPPLRDMVFNVRIIAKESFYVRNNLVRSSVRPDLVLTGTGENPLLAGKVYVESARLYLPAGRMQIETGFVRFEQAYPERPRLDFVGTSTMLGYDIKAVINGPYDEPVITLSSVPPLPNDELLMLLLTGKPPENSAGDERSMRQELNIAVFLGRDLISRLFGSDSDEYTESIIERFDVEVGRGITQSGEDTIHSQFRIADDVLTDGDSLYLTGERDYFDYYNGGIKLVFRFR